MDAIQRDEWISLSKCPVKFIYKYCHIYDATRKTWLPFRLWPAQVPVIKEFQSSQLVVILKARQIGMTWLSLCYAIWLMVFRPEATVGIFSRRDDEAVHLVDFRMKGIHSRLPAWMKSDISVSNSHTMTLSNGSTAMAFPPNAGDSYTFSLAIADEFDLVVDQDRLIRGVKPAIDAGGGFIILSRADKSRPGSEFKKIYLAAKEGRNSYSPIFLSWRARPDRTEEWYEQQKRDAESTGSLDRLYEQYPNTDAEALAIRGTGLVYPVWSDTDNGNVTEEADYVPDGGHVYWAADDGYAGEVDDDGHYKPNAHPRTFGFYQYRNNGDLVLFYEHYACKVLSEAHLAEVMLESEKHGWPKPEFVCVDRSAAELKGRFHSKGMYTRNGPSDVEESIKEVMGWLAPDKNGHRRFRIHPRCKETIFEYNNYRRNSDTSKIVKAFDHGCDRDRYLIWTMRHERE